MTVVDLFLTDDNIIKGAVIFKDRSLNGAVRDKVELTEYLMKMIENRNSEIMFNTKWVRGKVFSGSITAFEIRAFD